jgi:hypothetical protein
VVIGNAAEKDIADQLGEVYKGFDIIIDDASHAWGDQRVTFENCWGLLSQGGYYVVEDLVCGSLGAFPNYPPKVVDSQPFINYVKDRMDILNWCPDWNPEYNRNHFEQLPDKIQRIEREIDSVMSIHGACIIRKR